MFSRGLVLAMVADLAVLCRYGSFSATEIDASARPVHERARLFLSRVFEGLKVPRNSK